MKKKNFLIIAPLFFLIGCENNGTELKSLESTTNNSAKILTTETSSSFPTEEQLPEEQIRSASDGNSIRVLSNLPVSEFKQSLESVKKIICTKTLSLWTREQNEDFVADLKNKEMYLYPGAIDRTEPDWKLTDSDVKTLLQLLENYQIQDWETEYIGTAKNSPNNDSITTADGGTFPWTVLLVFEDNTIEKHTGSRTMVPDNFHEFYEELLAFREEKREEWRKTLD
ncbi:hypothetical protein ACYSNR_14240 [Enterococcus sp. LJL128]